MTEDAPETVGLPARRAALRLLDAVLRKGLPLEAALAAATRDLARPEDRGLAHAIAAETLRRLPDLIIADGPAPGENGTAVVEMLRNEFNVEVPALLVSAAAGPVAERGGLPVLHRPFHAGRLRTLINNLLHAPVARARRAS